MGTIRQRQRRDGSFGYTAFIRMRRAGVPTYTESRTFDRKAPAAAWMKRREVALEEPGALDPVDDPTLAEVIDRYTQEGSTKIGRTKAQVLRSIKTWPLADMRCSRIKSTDILAFAKSLPGQAATVANYLSHLAAVFAIARPAWGYPLDQQAIKDAHVVARRLGVTAKSTAILDHFEDRERRRSDSTLMRAIILFALFSTRRLEEITRISWDDLDEKGSRVLVRDMKNPGEKRGNHVSCDLPPEALAIIRKMPRADPRLFPYSGESIGTAFTRAIKFLQIDDLHFHDLRHEGISRLFEMGWSVPKVATVSGHRSWSSLKRYTHMRQDGDKYSGWPRLAEFLAT
jgi:integrase